VIGLALIQEAPAPGRFFDAALNALSAPSWNYMGVSSA
jgi:hypothetical protein